MDKIREQFGGNNSTVHKLNWLRAAVLGANDGIVSIAGLVLGVAGATSDARIIFFTGIAGIVAGAISMAAGEYVSVSSSRDTERAIIKKEKKELKEDPEGELEELTQIYISKGISDKIARQAAIESTKKDALAAHALMELNIDPNNLTNPWHAAIASALAFTAGAMIPLIAITVPPSEIKVPVAFISVIIALAITGSLSAYAGGAGKLKATARVVTGGALAMVITYAIGKLFSISGL